MVSSAQGATQAVEDGAVLGALLGNLRRKADIRDRLLMYERLRKPRTSRVRELSAENLQMFHMLNCAHLKKKGAQNKSSKAGGGSSSSWADPGFRDWLFEHDVVKEAEEMRESGKA